MSEENVKSQSDSTKRHDHQTNGFGSSSTNSRLDMEGGVPQEKPDPVREFRDSLKGLSDAATEFGQARVDGIRVAARNVMLKVVLAVVGAVAATVFLVVSMVLLLMGLAGGTARLFSAPLWVGYLIVGAVCVGVPLTVLLIQAKRIKAQWLDKLRDKYAGRTEIQREE
jgi:hypothetical protein